MKWSGCSNKASKSGSLADESFKVSMGDRGLSVNVTGESPSISSRTVGGEGVASSSDLDTTPLSEEKIVHCIKTMIHLYMKTPNKQNVHNCHVFTSNTSLHFLSPLVFLSQSVLVPYHRRYVLDLRYI